MGCYSKHFENVWILLNISAFMFYYNRYFFEDYKKIGTRINCNFVIWFIYFYEKTKYVHFFSIDYIPICQQYGAELVQRFLDQNLLDMFMESPKEKFLWQIPQNFNNPSWKMIHLINIVKKHFNISICQGKHIHIFI